MKYVLDSTHWEYCHVIYLDAEAQNLVPHIPDMGSLMLSFGHAILQLFNI